VNRTLYSAKKNPSFLLVHNAKKYIYELVKINIIKKMKIWLHN